MRYGQKCLLCGREAPTGLQVMGCLICFSCEKRLLRNVEVETPRPVRLRLNHLYGRRRPKGNMEVFHF